MPSRGVAQPDDALLRARWRSAAGAVTAAGPAALDAAFDAVVSRYRDPDRRYHGVVHLMRVVEAVHDLADATPQPVDRPVVTLAAFYHDAVLDPSATDNEAASADLAARSLRHLGADDSTSERVAALVRATAGHLGERDNETDIDTAVLLDADVSVLGSEPAVYEHYVDGVRREYHSLSDDAWRSGRSRVLMHLLAHSPLFLTVAGRQRWEARAHANLTAELARWRTRA